ncbi:MAG: DUF87 domain-containing protein [Spirochaetia bacterium]|nr:DUF87 domain-containing protein [Spirochaetia bacterium]
MTRKGMSFWWMVPYSGVFYYSFYILSQLLSKNRAPQLIMERLNQAPTMALILVILLLLLEVTLFILFSILSGKLYKRAKEKRKGMNTIDKKKKRAKREDKEVKESISKETIEKEVSQEAKPLSFPEIKNVPGLQTIRAKSDTQDEMYVGKLNKLPDETFILTSTPIGMIEDELVEENVSLTSLKRQLKLDESTKGVRVPTSMPSFLNTVKEKEQQRAVEEFSPISTKEETIFPKKESPLPTSQPVKVPENSPIKEEVIVEDDDIDYVSGVGGLVSTVDAPSSLLSRKKINYQYPSADLLDSYPNHTSEVDQETIDAGENLMETLKEFKIEAKVSAIVKGPTVTMYELTLAPGVRISSISNLADNIAMELAAISVRIVAPIPGKQAVGIEVPNAKRSIIGFKDLLSSVASHSFHLPMILGRKITGEPVVMDLTRTPHLLIAGATGSGKSVCVNSLISSLLYFKSPKEVRLILVDPKIVELRIYNGIPHLLTPVITEPKKTIKALEFCLFEMERRYKLLNSLAVRNIGAYNTKIAHSNIAREKLPYIVVVIDEFADIMTTVGKELETLLARLAAMARAVGIHLVLATQRPSADIITGIIKSNIPTRIAFSVSGQVNSRIIIDEGGAEKLLGGGDMLFVPSWEPSSTRIQGAFLSDDEVERVVNYVKSQGEPDYLDEAFFEDENENGRNGDDDEFDEGSDEAMREKAIKIIIERNGASASYLQRRLRIGYNKAARLIEELEDEGIVGPSRGSKPRELLRMPD